MCFQAAYLVAVADPSSVAGRPGLIDQAQFINSKQEILEACQNLLKPEASQQQVRLTAVVYFYFIYKLRQRRKNNRKKTLTGENSQNDKFQYRDSLHK